MANFFENRRRALVVLLLSFILLLGLGAMIGDSAIVDEIAHIPAGYSYVAFGDYRLNPEHPPLIKDLAGLPLLFLNLKFPTEIPAWTSDVNGQWEAGWHFLYHYGNSAQLILFFSRLPILLLAVFFGWLIYAVCRKNFGTKTALLSLFFYALSPNFLAHNHLVTTDLGITFSIFLALTSFGLFLNKPSGKTLAGATVGLAIAQLTKFSAVLLLPFYFGIICIVLLATKNALPFNFYFAKKIPNLFLKRTYTYLLSYIIMIAASTILVWIFYVPHTLNFPPDKQAELIRVSLPSEGAKPIVELYVKMSYNKFFQPLAQYLLGVTMVFGRVAGGNTTYFLGAVSNQSFKWYFPASYLLKEPLALLLLTVLACVLAVRRFFALRVQRWWATFKLWTKNNLLKLIFLFFAAFYVAISISGNLNLGIRHLFPIFPLIYILVSDSSIKFFESFSGKLARKISLCVLGLLLFWYGVSSVASFPHYISYHNEIIGGGKNAYLYFTDSNVDWGQDLVRLKSWVNAHPEFDKLKFDYFGGGEPKYYFCARKYDGLGNLIRTPGGYDCANSVYQEWHAQYGQARGWIAVSVTFLQNAKYYAQKFGQSDYDWLRNQTPAAKIGNSIFVYNVK